MGHSMRSRIDANRVVLAVASVSAIIEKANRDIAEDAVYDPTCTRDWAGCPDGWGRSGNSCLAPASYTGPCARAVEFEGGIPEKKHFADDCKAPWPCAGRCPSGHGHDYDSPGCPEGWARVGRFCEAARHPLAATKCGDRYMFAGMSMVEKQSITIACGLVWPCVSCTIPCSASVVWRRHVGMRP